MTPVLKPKALELGSGEPSAADLESVRHSYIPAKIYTRADLPAAAQDLALVPTISDQDGVPIPPAHLYSFIARPSNTLADFYWTYQTLATLENYAQDATEGRALMLNHDTYGDMPAGYSYAGRVVVDSLQEQAARAALALIDERAPLLSPSDPLAWLYASFYMVRDTNLAKRPTNDIISAIQNRVWRDVSVQFFAERMQCSICGLDMWDWDCPHIPGVEYDPFGSLMRCLAAIIGGRLLETSIVYKGATPDAGIVQSKARMITSTQRLTQGEARQITAMEARLGQRIVDPAQLQRVWSKVVTVPTNLASASTSPEPPTDAPRPANHTTQNKETHMRTKLQGPARAASGSGGSSGGNTGVDQQVIADQASSDAQALADQITAKQGAISAQQAVLDGLNAQVTASENQVDAAGDAIDNTDMIAGLNQQITGAQSIMDSLNADLVALQAELDGVNATADATGGTSVTQPAADAGSTTPPASPPPPQANSVPQRARAALGQMRAMMQNHVAPMRTQMRDVTADQVQPVVDLAQQLADALNQLLTDAGAPPARSIGDRVIYDALKRAAGGKDVSFAFVRTLVQEAQAGKQYISDLQNECVSAQVRAFGAANVNETDYRQMLRSLDVSALKRELDRLDTAARGVFTAGRSVHPQRGSGSVDMDDPENLPSYASGSGSGGGLFTN